MILPQQAAHIWTARSWHSLAEITDEVLKTPPRLWPSPLEPLPGAGKLRIPAERPLNLADRVAAAVEGIDLSTERDMITDHALLVVWGLYAQHLGLLEKLDGVPVAQQSREHTPQTKIIEFLVGILAGIEYLQDLNKGSHPIVHDLAVVEAWARQAFAHYSGVSRTLEAADPETVEATVCILKEIAHPFIQNEVMTLLRQALPLVVDVDLTGRRVSPTSTTYPEADFGWMDGEVAKGYQAAITSLVGWQYGRLLLTAQRYPGRQQSAESLQAAVGAAEDVLKVRPRRRVELVQARREQLAAGMTALRQREADQMQRRAEAEARRQEEVAREATLVADLTRLEAEYQAQGREERPHSKLAKARRRLETCRKRQRRAERDRDRADRQVGRLNVRAQVLSERVPQLDERIAQLAADNAANPNPVPIILRIDAGFSTAENVTWLIEMGYIVYTKVHNEQTNTKLRRGLTENATWSRVGKNAWATYLDTHTLSDCPYPVDLMLVHYRIPDGDRYTTLVAYNGDHPRRELKDWFRFYNCRQTIEAGIKEGKGVFPMRRPLVRSPAGLQLQEQFSLFAANFVRWAAVWVKRMVRQANRTLTKALNEVKTMVRVAAHTSARIVHNALGQVLIFDQDGPYAGSIILLSGEMTYQLALPLFNVCDLSPTRRNRL